MTSPVDTTVKYFSSAMSGAPVLSGAAGALIGVLDACLKDGFDLKTAASVVVAAGVCTVSWVGTHSALPDAVILVAGVTDKTALNGEQKVVTKTATSLTFATAASDGAASGTITFKIAPAGWTKAFAGTNLAAYQSSDPASTKCLLRVDDAGTTSCRVVGYESMSDINTGVGPFPTPAQMSGGGYWPKSNVASGAAVVWSLFADARLFYLCVQVQSSGAPAVHIGTVRGFGDGAPYKPGGDAYLCVLPYSSNATTNNQVDGSLSATGEARVAVPREYTGLGSAVLSQVFASMQAGGIGIQSGITNWMGPFPSAIDGALWLSPKYIANPGAYARGGLPGILHCMQSGMWNSWKQNDRAVGTGAFAGRNLIAATCGDGATAFNTVGSTSNTGVVFFDATGPWAR